ncbi:hypothetical protein CDD80_5641 [Ophiocordyceps camponoti-rufipedis]|uniref:Uncharacterized protein n=1 Tax=Ophiocordyceps camponoti-rufipedis TaxID=2004952 RepID=A0A2C5ZH79_9HYPO|nr:hypothetical protein CDD80_5641 [Ophiocordyceps camponoti-rufipedis]
MPPRQPIAIVGIGCRFPGPINSAPDLWQALTQSQDVISQVPPSRFDAPSLQDDDARKYGAIRSSRGGFLDDVHGFDAEFFGLYPAEANRMDPQHRLLLEASVHALEDSGTPLEDVAGSTTSVFVGAFMYDHLVMQSAADQRDTIGPYTAHGVVNFSLANRISHRLNLQGASVSLDSACSSSLVAVHLACESIWSGSCEGALAGGVNAILRPEGTMLLSMAGFLSPDGACKPFDAAANGYVRSEGVGVVYLKPLASAIRDGNDIYATIRGCHVNSDGYTADGYTVPNPQAQTTLLSTAYASAGLDPSMVGYVECHGPGTPVGDPVEAAAVGGHIGQASGRDEALWIGSVKGNLGHCEGASGIASFIKAALILRHGTIPPQTNHNNPNPIIDFGSLGLRIPRQMVPLPNRSGTRRIVGVNSFGAGGTNAHVILQEADPLSAPPALVHEPRVLIFSAKSLAALEHMSRNLLAHLQHHQPHLKDVVHTLAKRRSRHNHIAVIPVSHQQQLLDCLDHLGSGQPSKETLVLENQSEFPRIVFVFSGQGGQWIRMGQSLAEQEPIFRDSLLAFDTVFRSKAGFSIVDEISKPQGESRIDSTVVVQPATVALQIALARTLMSYGLKPEAIVGHSIGEVSAAHISGALTLEQAVTVIYERSQSQKRVAGLGSMLAVGLSSSEAHDVILSLDLDHDVAVAALNGPRTTIMTGDSTALHLIESHLKARQVFVRSVNVEVPYHSHFMDPLEHDLVESLATIRGVPTDIPLYSTVTASLEPGTHLDGHYWFDNVRKPVRYVETAAKLIDNGFNLFVEVGPHPVLLSGTREIAQAASRGISALPAMTRVSHVEPLARVLGAAYALGADVDISSFNGGAGRLLSLPLYPFQRKHYSSEHPEAKHRRLRRSRHPFDGGSTKLTDDGRAFVRLRASTGTSPFLAEHVAEGAILFPATAHIEAAYMAANEFLSLQDVCLRDVRFKRPLVLTSSQDYAPQVLLEITSEANEYAISTRPADASPSSEWRICSTGRIDSLTSRSPSPVPEAVPEALETVASRLRLGKALDVDEFYSTLEKSGLRYGDAFRGIKMLWHLGTEIYASVKLPSAQIREAARFRLHPALLDACMHASFAHMHRLGDSGIVYLPHHIETVNISACASGETDVLVHVKIHHHDGDSVRADARVYTESGRVVATMTAITFKRFTSASGPEPVAYEASLQEASLPAGGGIQDFDNILVLGDDSGEFASLARKAFPRASVSPRPASWISDFPKDFPLGPQTLILLAATGVHVCSSDASFEQLGTCIGTLLQLSRWVQDRQETPTLAVVVAGAFMAPLDSQCNPISAAIEAAVRVMANELPQMGIRVIDLPSNESDWPLQSVQEELLSTGGDLHDTVVALRPHGRFIRRITAVDADEHLESLPARGGKYSFELDPAGLLDKVVARRQAPTSLAPGEVAIQVHAASLNSVEVINMSEKSVSGVPSDQNLGLEVAGKVIEVGEDVINVQLGTNVMARVANGLSGYVTTDSRSVNEIPGNVTMAQAASIPVDYVTAFYALVHVGRLTRRDSVLVHAAAGGVGAVAIQIAKLYGARIFATADSPESRQWVVRQGVQDVFDSTSAYFHHDVKAATDDRGVDVVLNCHSGPLLNQTLACLAPFGRFIELGKTGMSPNMMEAFGENRSFMAVDISLMILHKPDLYSDLLASVCKLLETGELIPPPVAEHPITQLPETLKRPSPSEFIGKTVMTMSEDATVETLPPTRLRLRADRSYLVTGGASGLGLQMARFLSERGAKHVILASRTGPKKAEDEAVVRDMKNRGVVVKMEHVDVGNREAVAALFAKRDLPTIAGIIHCAGVAVDRHCYEMSLDDFWAAFNAKAIGAWNLHLATENMALEFFVLTSSSTSLVGSHGQLNYVAANQFLDSLALHRRANGLAGLSLKCGVLGDFAGMTAGSKDLLSLLRSQGWSVINLPLVLDALEHSILQGAKQRLIANIDWAKFLRAYPRLISDSAFAGLETQDDAASSDLSLWTLESIAEVLRERVAAIVGVDASRLSVTEKIDKYSFDSLTLTQIRSSILDEFRVSYPMVKLSEGKAMKEVAKEVAGQLGIVETGDEKKSTMNGEAGRGRLVLFPPMGAGASFFSDFLVDPPDDLDAVAVQLPERENRSQELVPLTMAEIVDGILSEIGTVKASDLFWGHSIGGLIAFETMTALRGQGKELPRLTVSGTLAPHLTHRLQKREAVLKLLNDGQDSAWSLAQQFRRDVPYMKGYRRDEVEMRLQTQITAFAARQDEMAYPDEG